MKKIQAVIFDMDGVLFDTERAYMKRLNRFMRQDGMQIDMEMQMKLLGSSDNDKWNYINNLYNQTQTREEFFKRYDAFYKDDPFSYQKIIFDEVEDTLHALSKRGYRLALASSSIKKEIEIALTQCNFQHLFTSILSGEECIATKPDPQIYLDTLHKLNLKAEDCIVIEDSEIGIKAAKGAGLRVIARKDDYINVDQSKADYIIHHHHEIIEIINKLEERSEYGKNDNAGLC